MDRERRGHAAPKAKTLDVRQLEKGSSISHSARPVHSMLPIKNLFLCLKGTSSLAKGNVKKKCCTPGEVEQMLYAWRSRTKHKDYNILKPPQRVGGEM